MIKITLDSIKSRLRLISDIETAAIACKLEEDGMTIRQDQNIVIAFSISTRYYISKDEEKNIVKRYAKIAADWKNTIFGKDSDAHVFMLDSPIHSDTGKFKKLSLLREPNMIITKEDLGQRFADIGGIKEAWIVCVAGDPEEYINYRYDMGIYIKLVDEETYKRERKHKDLWTTLHLLFESTSMIHDLVYLEDDVTEIEYKWMNLKLEDMTRIL